MHEGSGKTRRSGGRVDRVEVAGHIREGRHIGGRDDGGAADEGTRRVRKPNARRNRGSARGRLGRGDSAADCEALSEAGEADALEEEFEFDAHDTARGGL